MGTCPEGAFMPMRRNTSFFIPSILATSVRSDVVAVAVIANMLTPCGARLRISPILVSVFRMAMTTYSCLSLISSQSTLRTATAAVSWIDSSVNLDIPVPYRDRERIC